MKTSLFVAVATLALLLSACSGSGTQRYLLEGGDPEVDWVEFAPDSTVLWVAPGGVLERSPYEEGADGTILVHVAPFSSGRLHRVDSRTLRGEVPFFEGTWKKVRFRR